jgi:hypothetical protein
MQSRACSCYAEAMVFFGRSPKNAVLVAIQKGGQPSVRRGDGAALLGFGLVGFAAPALLACYRRDARIRLLRVSGLTVRKIAFQMLKA